MHSRFLLIAATSALLLLASAQDAQAGLFGGFTSGGSYLRGADQLCTPVASEMDVSKCQAQTTAQLSAQTFAMGTKQQGTTKVITAKKSASKIKVHDAQDGSPLFSWDSGKIVSATGAVFLDASGQWAAVEFTSRLGNRQVDDLIVMRLAKPIGAVDATLKTKPDPKPTAKPTADTSPADPPAFTAAMKLGAKWDRKRKYSKAITAYGVALKQIPSHPEALYRLARSYMGSKKRTQVVETLALIPKSTHAKAVHFRVEARFDIVFKSLRGDVDFRKAVGIERGPDDPPSLYERLVAFGGRWEQERIPCEQPQVDLALQRNKKRRFDLIIRSKCQGSIETTRLDGSWQESGDRNLGLSFPNTTTADEDLVCKLERCSDDSGEDCLRCQLDQDMEILLRTVRR